MTDDRRDDRRDDPDPSGDWGPDREPEPDELLDLPLGGREEEEPGLGPETEEPSGGPWAEEPPPPGDAGGPRARNRLPYLLLTALVLVLLLALAGLAGYLLPRPTPPVVRAEPSVVDFGTRSVGVAGDAREVAVTSTGERPARVDGVAVVAPPGAPTEVRAGDGPRETVPPFEITSDGCSGSTVEPGGRCTVAVAFTPAGTGSRRAVLELRGNFANAPLELPLLGEGVAPHPRVDRREVGFGSHPVGGRPVSEALRVENDGTAPLELDAVVVEGAAADDFSVSAAACTRAPLAPGDSCPVSVSFAPTAQGPRRATLRLRPGPSARGIETPSVDLTGTGLPGGGLESLEIRRAGSPAGAPTQGIDEGLSFGAAAVDGGAAERALTLTNRGDEPLRLARIEVSAGGDAFSLAGTDCPAEGALAAGASCRVTVRFAPRGDPSAAPEGEVEGTLTVAPAEAPQGIDVRLRGRAVVPRLVPRPTTVDFGESRVGRDGPSREVVFSSTGSGAVAVDAVGSGGPDAGAFTVRADTCTGATLDPGDACRMEIVFHPRQEGVQGGRLEVRSPSLAEPPTVMLRGAGAAPRLGVEPPEVDFGRVAVTRSETRSLTLESAGRAPLEVRRIELVGDDADDFRIDAEDCTAPLALAPEETCRVTLRFTPSAEGTPRATLRIAHDGGGAPTLVELRATALPAPAPRFRVAPERIDFGSVAPGGRSGIETVTVKNGGDARLVIEAVRLEGAGAGDFRIVPGSCEGAAFVSPGSECTLGVRFTPAGAGPRRAELVIRHTAAGGIGRVELAGTGAPRDRGAIAVGPSRSGPI